MFDRFHHVAVICSDYPRSKAFYNDVLGLAIVDENWREASRSWKCDLEYGAARIELFSFPDAPRRASRPEAQGLRHLAFAVADLDAAVTHLQAKGVEVEPVRIDPYTEMRFTFFTDPDGLPLELYETA
jgi:glyoxylase I family protein